VKLRFLTVLSALVACAGEPQLPPPAPQPVRRPAPVVKPAPVPVAVIDSCPALAIKLPELTRDDRDPATVPDIVDEERLAPFFDKVARLMRGEASDHIRIAVYGDSNLTMDYMTGQMRRRLQLEFGDAGHGFVALGRPWSHYKHMDVLHDVKKGFDSYACSTDPAIDRMYGISGIAAESAYKGAKTWVATAGEDAPIGHSVSRLDIYYLKGKRKGTFDIYVDRAKYRTINSRDRHKSLGIERIELEDGPHRVMMEATDARRRVRLLGATLERAVAPSFIVDSFGVGAMNTRSQAMQHRGINIAMLEHRRYDLIIFATGANDVFTLDVTPKHLGDIIELQRKALPGVPILLMTPPDRGREDTFPHTLLAVKQRRELAKLNKTAMWDLWEAMGGRGSMREFKRRGFSKPDYIHFSEAGGAWAGDRFMYALWRGLERYVKGHPDAGCDAYEGVPAGGGVAKPR
jgi:hypothetical protein